MFNRPEKEYFNRMHTYSTERAAFAVEFIKKAAAAGSNFLDIGCGVGNIMEFIHHETGIKKVEGIDISENCVRIAADKGMNVKRVSVLDSCFEKKIGKKFDFVLLLSVIHHLPGRTRKEIRKNVVKALNNAGRVLKPNGFLLIGEISFKPKIIMPVGFYIKKAISSITRNPIRLGKISIGMPIACCWSKEQLFSIIKEAGFELVKTEETKKKTVLPFVSVRHINIAAQLKKSSMPIRK